MTIPPPTDWTDDSSRPPVVIAIPNWNRGELLHDCVDSILRLTAYPHYRVCVFDQGSTDSSRDHLRGWGDRIDTIVAPDNVGYIPANNAVIDRYPDWDVLLLNNDTRIIDPAWLDTLVMTAYSAADIGLVGAKLVYPDGQLQEAGSQLFRNGGARAYGKFEDPADPAYNIRRDVDFSSAACLFVKRAVLRACGGFELCYLPCYYEDVDLALKARAAGFRTVYEPAASVVHKEYGTSGRAAATDQMIRNRDILVNRWNDVLARHPRSLWEIPPGDRRERALVVGDAIEADTAGRADRSKQLLDALSGAYAVAYAHTDPATAGDRLRLPDDWGVTAFYPGLARAIGSPDLDLAAIVSHNRFRWVIFDSPRIAAGWIGLVRGFGGDARVAIDAALAPASDCAAYAAADGVIAGTRAQRDAIRRACPPTPVALLPRAADGNRRRGILRSTVGRVLAAIRGRERASIPEILAQLEHDVTVDPGTTTASVSGRRPGANHRSTSFNP